MKNRVKNRKKKLDYKEQVTRFEEKMHTFSLIKTEYKQITSKELQKSRVKKNYSNWRINEWEKAYISYATSHYLVSRTFVETM